jgi:hypothetical protein
MRGMGCWRGAVGDLEVDDLPQPLHLINIQIRFIDLINMQIKIDWSNKNVN